MTSARDLFGAAGDTPEPPLRSSADVLRSARRAARRRGHLQALLGGVTLAAVAGGATMLMPRTGPMGVSPQPAAPAVSSAVSTPDAEPSAPSATSAHAHAGSVDEILADAVPAGFDAEPATLTGTASAHGPVSFAWAVDVAKGHYRELSLVRVTKAAGVGLLMAVVGNDGPTIERGTDLCTAMPTLGIEGATNLTCDVVDTDGVRVRVVTGTAGALGDVISAVRFIHGGYVEVVVSQGLRAYRQKATSTGAIWQISVNPAGEPILDALPLTARQLAALAAEPGLLP